MWFIGVDGGGSKCRALISDEKGRTLGVGLGGPANPLHGYEQAVASVMSAIRDALHDAGLERRALTESIACLGLAGVNLPSLRQRMLAWQHPFAGLHLVTDLHIACRAAHDGGDGAVIISGTGSCGVAVVGDTETIFGAHGFPMGDKGSGAWLGLEALRYYLLADDGFVERGALYQAFQQHFQTDDALAIIEVMAGKGSSAYAALAKLVFNSAEQHDAHAIAMLKDGANYLDQLADKLLRCAPPRLTMVGGLTECWQPWLRADIAAKLQPALIVPEAAAAKLAHAQAHKLSA